MRWSLLAVPLLTCACVAQVDTIRIAPTTEAENPALASTATTLAARQTAPTAPKIALSSQAKPAPKLAEIPTEEMTVTGHSVAGYWMVTGPRLVDFDAGLFSGLWIKYSGEVRVRNICLVYDKDGDLTAICSAGVGRVARGSLDGNRVSLHWWQGPANLIFRGDREGTETVRGELSGGMLGLKLTGGVPVTLNRIAPDAQDAAPADSAALIVSVLDDLEKGTLTEGRYDGKAITDIKPLRDTLQAAGHPSDIRYLGTIHNLWRKKQRETAQDVYRVEFPDGIRLCRIEVGTAETVADFDCRSLAL